VYVGGNLNDGRGLLRGVVGRLSVCWIQQIEEAVDSSNCVNFGLVTVYEP
jgi:hypothetical protein